MPTIDTYRKRAKLLVRWHAERNYSVGEKLRLIERHRHLTDTEILDMPLPLTLAQEIIAVEAGFENWRELRSESALDKSSVPRLANEPKLMGSVPILFVEDVAAATWFYREKLGFAVDFLHGKPPFYGSVSRGACCLHLRFVHRTNFVELAEREVSLILVTIEVTDVKSLFDEYLRRGVDFPQRLVRQAWGGLDFHVRDPAGNVPGSSER
jgi:catechol 2,3-dioxygenase-like lactoylglutathione lyase family enzyme